MNREKTLLKNTIILTIGKVSTQLITFFLLPLYTGILSTEEYGIVDLLNTLVSLLLPVVTFQIEQAVFRKLIEVRENENDKKIIISTATFSVMIQCIIYIFIFSIISPMVNNDYKIFLATNVIAYIFSSLFQQISRGLGDNKKYSIASFISASATIIFNVIFLVVVKLGANGMLLGNMFGQIMCIIYLYVALKLYKYISYKAFKYVILKKMWKYSIPLVPNAISWWIFDASDRIIVSSILGVAKNGILSAAHKFSNVYITIYNIFYLSWTEMISVHIEDKDIENFFNKIFNTVLKFFITMGIGLITCIPFIYPIIINEKFNEAYNQIPILILGSIFNIFVGLLSAIYVAKKNTKAIANTSIISAIINITVNIMLIKFIGLYASTISTFFAYFVMSIYRLHDVQKRYFRIRIQKNTIIKTLIILIISLPTYYIENVYLRLLSLILVITYAIDLNKDSIGWMLNMIKEKIKL